MDNMLLTCVIFAFFFGLVIGIVIGSYRAKQKLSIIGTLTLHLGFDPDTQPLELRISEDIDTQHPPKAVGFNLVVDK